MGFSYGEDVQKADVSSGSFKNPNVGQHPALLRSFINLGMFEEEFNGVKKPQAPEVTAIFELIGAEDVDDEGNQLCISKSFALRGGDKALLTTFEKIFLKDGDTSPANWIGRPCQVEVKAGKELKEDKTPKYVNFGGLTSMVPDLEAMYRSAGKLELNQPGVGFVEFKDLTRAAIEELHPITEVADILMQSPNYPGSQAEQLVAEIRKEKSDFAVRKPKGQGQSQSNVPANGADAQPSTPANPPAALDDSEEF